jgi:hypothetical protein
MVFDESFEIFDEEQSREIIIDFIQINPGCIAEHILKGQNQIGRKKLFRILRALKEEKIIIEERPKSKTRVRNKKLFVNRSSPQAVVLNELKKFEKIYRSISNKTIDAYNNGRYLGDWEKSSDEIGLEYSKILNGVALIWQPVHIFIEFMKIYMIRLITKWSEEIRDKSVLYKVNNVVFAKFASMQIHTHKVLASASNGVGPSSAIPMYMHMQSSTDALTSYSNNLSKCGMEQEAKGLSKFREHIFVVDEMRSYFRRKNKRYRWDLKYKDDDFGQLAGDMIKNWNYIDDAHYDDHMSSTVQ